MGLAAVILGHNYPRVTEAVARQMQDGVSFSLPHLLELELAELLVDIIPCAEMVRFGKNGSDATSGIADFAIDGAGQGTGTSGSFSYGDGAHTISAVATDEAGNVSAALDLSGIQIDTQDPTASLVIEEGASYTIDTLVDLEATDDDGTGSGVIEVRASNDGVSFTPWVPFSSLVPDWDLTLFGGNGDLAPR